MLPDQEILHCCGQWCSAFTTAPKKLHLLCTLTWGVGGARPYLNTDNEAGEKSLPTLQVVDPEIEDYLTLNVSQPFWLLLISSKLWWFFKNFFYAFQQATSVFLEELLFQSAFHSLDLILYKCFQWRIFLP